MTKRKKYLLGLSVQNYTRNNAAKTNIEPAIRFTMQYNCIGTSLKPTNKVNLDMFIIWISSKVINPVRFTYHCILSSNGSDWSVFDVVID